MTQANQSISIGSVFAVNREIADIQKLTVTVVNIQTEGGFRVQMGAAQMHPNDAMQLARHIAAAAQKAGGLNIFGSISR